MTFLLDIKMLLKRRYLSMYFLLILKLRKHNWQFCVLKFSYFLLVYGWNIVLWTKIIEASSSNAHFYIYIIYKTFFTMILSLASISTLIFPFHIFQNSICISFYRTYLKIMLDRYILHTIYITLHHTFFIAIIGFSWLLTWAGHPQLGFHFTCCFCWSFQDHEKLSSFHFVSLMSLLLWSNFDF